MGEWPGSLFLFAEETTLVKIANKIAKKNCITLKI